jgi:hypothetical protein
MWWRCQVLGLEAGEGPAEVEAAEHARVALGLAEPALHLARRPPGGKQGVNGERPAEDVCGAVPTCRCRRGPRGGTRQAVVGNASGHGRGRLTDGETRLMVELASRDQLGSRY